MCVCVCVCVSMRFYTNLDRITCFFRRFSLMASSRRRLYSLSWKARFACRSASSGVSRLCTGSGAGLLVALELLEGLLGLVVVALFEEG